MQILVVEDEQRMAGLLQRGLTEEGHHVVVARDGATGLETARATPFDVIVLDMMLPRIDGLTVARRLRDGRNQTPILMLTAKDADADVIRGLDAGADDYLTKPFSFEILLARLRAVSRRGVIPRPVCLGLADLRLDPATRRVTRGNEVLNLTPARIQSAGVAAQEFRQSGSARDDSRIRLGLRLRRRARIRSKHLCGCCA